jgi:hemerythrin superfamily protein
MPSTDEDLRSKLTRPKCGLRLFAAERHRELASAVLELTSTALSEDPHVLATRWRELDEALRDHMAAEEDLIIPAYQLSEPEEADELRTEHARIRGLLDEIGVDVRGHTVDATRMSRLVELLQAHEKREDTSMYPWAERNLPRVTRRQLFVRISHWLRGRTTARASCSGD